MSYGNNDFLYPMPWNCRQKYENTHYIDSFRFSKEFMSVFKLAFAWCLSKDVYYSTFFGVKKKMIADTRCSCGQWFPGPGRI